MSHNLPPCSTPPATAGSIAVVIMCISGQEGRVSNVLLALRGGGSWGSQLCLVWECSSSRSLAAQVLGGVSAFLKQVTAGVNMNRMHSSPGMSQSKVPLLKIPPFLPSKPTWDYRNECKIQAPLVIPFCTKNTLEI